MHKVDSGRDRWIERVGPPHAAVRAPFPKDAFAVIYKPARSAMTSGRARKHHWTLRFERRVPKYIEPLMGWTADDDTLASEVELTFPSLEAAIGYARRQGLNFSVQGGGNSHRSFNWSRDGLPTTTSRARSRGWTDTSAWSGSSAPWGQMPFIMAWDRATQRQTIVHRMTY